MSPVRTATILIIEDSPGIRRIYADLLETDGFRVLAAEDGERGWTLARKERPDLILLDLVMPKMDGFEVLRRLRADPATKDVPVIVFSLLGEREDVQKALDLGATDFTEKGSYSPREVLTKIRALLEEHEAARNAHTLWLQIQGEREDAGRLLMDLGLRPGMRCPDCEGLVLQELRFEGFHDTGRRYAARFVCTQCERSF